LHEKSSKAIIIGPLKKAINRKRIGEEGVRQWKIKIRELEREREREKPRANHLEKKVSNCILGIDFRLRSFPL